ncbi:MAG: hypothetical protein KAQ87_00355 [Candidatus Pacebacteria bacterium]|nr:hypothetical protein [Candidatus Paceibacterota bacterium]
MKKESLQITTVKTLLAILLFVGMGTIIIRGGYIIWEYSKNGENNKMTKPIVQETENYYDVLEKKCGSDNCCVFSLKTMRENNYKEADKNGKCPEGFNRDMMACITSYHWCVPMEEIGWESCDKDNDCEVRFSHCDCRYHCVNKNIEADDCAVECDETGPIISECICENNKCVEKKSNISNWQTYQHEITGVKLQHPRDWQVAQDQSENYMIFNKFYLRRDSQEIEILKTSSLSPETMDMKSIGTHKVLVDGYASNIELFQGKFDNNKDKYYLRVFISEKNICYHAETDKDNLEELSLIFNQILSTFKFID